MFIFCSDLYTVDFVLEEFSKCKKAPIVDTVVIEDLMLRNDERLNKAAINLVYKTTLPPKDEFDLEDDVVLPRTPFERAWKSMTFRECISSADDYQKFIELRKELQIKDGGTAYLFFTTNMNNEKIVLVCKKVIHNPK